MVGKKQAAVVVIDDDRSVREALKGLLETVALKVFMFESVGEFLSAALRDYPNCIVLDVRLPGLSGLDFQKQLSNAAIHTPIVFITGHGDIPMSVRAMKGGAIEFLTKPFRDQDLLDAVSQGIERDRKRRADEQAIADLRRALETLTSREFEIMALLVAGQSSKQVAGKLGISAVTTRVHRGQIMKKMGARTIAELVRMADKLNAA